MTRTVDLAAWCCLFGLLRLSAGLLARAWPGLPMPVYLLLGVPLWGCLSFTLHAGGLPQNPLSGPPELMGPSWPLGIVGFAAGGMGLFWGGLQAVGRRSHRKVPVARLVAFAPLLAWPYTLLTPWAIDETAYHLALPLRARVLGALSPPLGHANGGLWALFDWFGSWGLAMGSLSAARGVQILLVCLAFHAACSLVGQHKAWRASLAGLLLLSSPVALWQLATSYVDLCCAAYLGVAALLWPEQNVVCCAECTCLFCAPSREAVAKATQSRKAFDAMATAGVAAGPATAEGAEGAQAAEAGGRDPSKPAGDKRASCGATVSHCTRGHQRRVQASALAMGVAAAGKPTAVWALGALAMLLVLSRRSLSKRAMLAAGVLAVLPALPFILFDLVTYGSPLFPFVPALPLRWLVWSNWPALPAPQALLPAQAEVWPRFMAMHGPHTADLEPIEGLMRWLLLPQALCFAAAFASPRFDGVVGGGLLLALCLGLARGCWRLWPQMRPRLYADGAEARAPRAVLVLTAWLAVGWLCTSWQARFLLPVLYLIALWTTLSWPDATQCGLLNVCSWMSQPARQCRRGLAHKPIVALVAVACVQAPFWPSLQGHMPLWPAGIWAPGTERVALRQRLVAGSATCDRTPASGGGLALVWTQRLLLWCPAVQVADSYDEAAHLNAWLKASSVASTMAAATDAHVTGFLVDQSLWPIQCTAAMSPNECTTHDDEATRWASLLAQHNVVTDPYAPPMASGVSLFLIAPESAASDKVPTP